MGIQTGWGGLNIIYIASLFNLIALCCLLQMYSQLAPLCPFTSLCTFWPSSNHWHTSQNLWGMWKRKIQETPIPNFKIKGTKTTWSSSFQSGWNSSSLHWQIQVYHHFLRWLLFIWGYVLPQKEKWRVRCIQQYKAWAKRQLGTTLKCRQFDQGGEFLSNEQKTYMAENKFEYQTYMPDSPQQKVPANHCKWSWGHAASRWLLQQFLDISCEG